MADETKRVIDQTTDSSLSAGDFIIVDSQSEGTRKFDLGTELTDIKQDLGDLDNLETEDKSSLVNAINEALTNGSFVEVSADGTTLIINTEVIDGNEVSY